MFKKFTFETLMERMLLKIPANMDKREGSVVWDALAAVAMELANCYIFLDMILDESFADTASYTFLAKRAAERGITPALATKAILMATFKPDNVSIPKGSRFNLGVLNYVVEEKMSDGNYRIICETEGTEGNKYFGKILPIDYVDGLQYGEITGLLIPAEDDEDIEAFRNRYFASFNNEAFGGNIADYKNKVNTMQGVGGVKVYPVWNGGGTVKLVIIDSEFSVPSEALVEQIQNKTDPPEHCGEGLGIAPIGHVVTVMGVSAETVNIESSIVVRDGLTWADIKPYAIEATNGYLEELARMWEQSIALVVRISQIESRLLNVDGVIDIYDTVINGKAGNLILGTDSIPIRGDIDAVN